MQQSHDSHVTLHLSSRIFFCQSLNERAQPLVRQSSVDEHLVLEGGGGERERGGSEGGE